MMLNNPNSRLSKSIILTVAFKEDVEDKARQNAKLASLVGTEGLAETNLRPSGIGRFGGKRLKVKKLET